MDLSEIGVGVVGTGFMGPVHVEALRRLGINVRGIVGSTPEKTRRCAEQLLLPKAYDSYEQMLDDPRVHAVHIGVPNNLHFKMTKQAIAAGKHVLCEKPLAMNSRETAELVRIAKSAAVVCGVNYNLRYYPLCREVASRIQSGVIGDPIYAIGGFRQDWLLHQTDFNWRVSRQQGGALRAIADIGTHWLDLVQHMTGQKVVELCADLQTVYPQRFRPPEGSVQTFTNSVPADLSEWQSHTVDTEDLGSMLLRFSNGMRGNVTISQMSAGRKNYLNFEIGGTKSALAWNAEEPNSLWIGHRDRSNEKLIKDPTLMTKSASEISAYPSGHTEGYPDTFKQCFRDFYTYIISDRSSAPSFPSFEDGHHEVVLCEAVLESNERRAWVEV